MLNTFTKRKSKIERYDFSKGRLVSLSNLLQPQPYNEVTSIIFKNMSIDGKLSYVTFCHELKIIGYSFKMCRTISRFIDKDKYLVWV